MRVWLFIIKQVTNKKGYFSGLTISVEGGKGDQ